MKKLLLQLGKESTVYGLSGIISRFISIFLVPLYTSVLTTADYGVLGLINTGFYFLIILGGFALENSAARWFYDTEDENERKTTVASWFFFRTFTTTIFCIVLFLFSGPISKILLESDQSLFIIIPAFSLIATGAPTVASYIFRFKRKPWHAFIFAIVLSSLTIALNVYFLLFLELGILGILYATLIANTLMTVSVFVLMPQWFSFTRLKLKVLKAMILFSLPLVPTAVSFWLLNSASSYFLNFYTTKSEIGLFQIGIRIASLLQVIITAFHAAWPAFAYSIKDKPEAKSVYSAVFLTYGAFLSFGALGISLFAREALMLFTTEEYYAADFVAGLLCFNGIIYGCVSILCIGLGIKKKTTPIAKSILLGSGLTAILYLVLIPNLGKNGAVISTMIGYSLIPILVAYYNQKVYPIPFKFGLAITFYLLALTSFLAYHFLFITDSLVSNIIIKCGILIFYMGLTGYLLYRNYPKKTLAALEKVRSMIRRK